MAAVANESVWVAAHQGHLERVKQLVEAEPRLATMRDEVRLQAHRGAAAAAGPAHTTFGAGLAMSH